MSSNLQNRKGDIRMVQYGVDNLEFGVHNEM